MCMDGHASIHVYSDQIHTHTLHWYTYPSLIMLTVYWALAEYLRLIKAHDDTRELIQT